MGSAYEEVIIPHYIASLMMNSESYQPFILGKKLPSKKFAENSKISELKFACNEQEEIASNDTVKNKTGRLLKSGSLGNTHQRSRHSRRVSEAEEIVKYMSSIPSYLQREDHEHDIQEKALNVGVLNWRRLQKWSDHEKVTANKINHNSPSSSNSSSIFSTFYSSQHSLRTNASPAAERKQSPAFNLAGSAEEHQIRRNDSSKKVIKPQIANIGGLPSASRSSENLTLLRDNAKVTRLDDLEKLEICIEQDSSRSPSSQEGDRPIVNSQHYLVAKDKRKHLEDIIARSILGFDAALLDRGNQRKMNGINLSGKFPLPPSSNKQRVEPLETYISEAIKNVSSERGRQLLPIVLPRVDSKGIIGSPLKSILDNPKEAAGRSTSRGRRNPLMLFFDQPRKSTSSAGSISDNPNLSGARSSSQIRRSSMKQMSDQPLNLSNPDVYLPRSMSRGRRSPLRQLLESPRKSLSLNISLKSQELNGAVDPPPIESSFVDPTSTRQALLKVSQKNGLPLLMFSSSDDSILVAMMHKRDNSDMNICDCVYEIHTALAVEVKKKNGAAWLSQGTRSKKPEFTCKFVAELIVSSSERVSFDLTHRSFVRELVLLGDELVPSNFVDAPHSASAELAAIVVKSSQHKPGSPTCSILCECDLCAPHIVAILPSGVHGLSSTRDPSKLIERWESGGSCDCGGWDEGCALTILANNSRQTKDSKSIENCLVADGNCGFDLFTEGDARKGKASFSVLSFKEDMFTVEFKASIPMLQAFAISIAMLHDRNHLNEVDSYENLSFDGYPPISS